MIPKSIKINPKRHPRTDLKNDSKNTSKLVPLDPHKLSYRPRGDQIFTKSAGPENHQTWSPNGCQHATRIHARWCLEAFKKDAEIAK